MTDRFIRQSFLGDQSESRLRNLHVAVVGLGGGGSHVVQQLAHLGVGQFSLFDPDRVEESNLNRLVGATAQDATRRTLKTAVASRTLRSLGSRFIAVSKPWQEHAMLLRKCDIVVGAVDSFSARDELERTARRFMLPYIDLGMDVHEIDGAFFLSGQVALSLPGRACLHCMGVLRADLLRKEAQEYGAAGGKPQVIWPNGVLASTSVGMLLSLVSPWHRDAHSSPLMEYDGNTGEVHASAASPMLQLMHCDHFSSANDLGDPWFDRSALR